MASSFWDIDDRGICRVHLHPGQRKVWLSEARFVFMVAGSQGGKTAFGPWWLNREIDRRGQGDYLAVTTSYDLFKLKMLPEMRTVFEKVFDRGRYWPGPKLIELKDPSGRYWARRADDPMWGRIILRSTQSEKGLEAATAKAAWLDEAGMDEFTLMSWEAILRRLAIHQGRSLATTTIYNAGWLKTEVYDEWKAGNTDFDVIQFASILNPSFPVTEFERAQKAMPTWRFKMFYEGEFAKPAGLILGDFREAQLVNDFRIPLNWPCTIGVDFGGANNAQAWFAEAPDRTIYLFHEVLEGGKSTKEHVATILEKSQPFEQVTFIGGAPSEKQSRIDWAEAGALVLQPPFSEVEAGIDKIVEAMKSDRLRVFRSCKKWRDEQGTYRRKLDTSGQPTDIIEEKRKFHLMDATRYALSRLMLGSGVDIIGLGGIR